MCNLFLEECDLLEAVELEGKFKSIQQNNEDFGSDPDREQGSIRSRTTTQLRKEKRSIERDLEKEKNKRR